MDDVRRLVKVKPLEWDRHPDANCDPSCNEHYGGGQNNLAGQNEYAIFPHPCATGFFVLDVMGNRCEEDFPSVEAAKAAAQADYEARILAALTPASDGRAEALREAAVWREAATIARDHGFTNAQWRAGGENARGALFDLFMARAAELEKADER